ncbi:MAG: hypothetical protein E5W38_06295 [Mesorhizobium sp.]|nr:MAG: hypothetical protein E5W38_06295 [Mesorhizobium sp.]
MVIVALPNKVPIPVAPVPETLTVPLLAIATSLPPAPMPMEANPDTVIDPELSSRRPLFCQMMPVAAMP